MASLARVNAHLDKWQLHGSGTPLFTNNGNSYTSPPFATHLAPDVKWRLCARNTARCSRCGSGRPWACDDCTRSLRFSLELADGGEAKELKPELFVVVSGSGFPLQTHFTSSSAKTWGSKVTVMMHAARYKEMTECVISACVSFNLPKAPEPEPSEVPGLVQGGFPRLLADADLADFEVRVGEERVPIHRALFAAFSPVFKRMFLGDAEEKAQGFVVVEDVSAEAVRGLRAFLYSGRVAEVRDDLATFLHLAEKYQIEELKGFCDSELRKTLSTANLCERAVLADRYGLEELFAACKALVKGKEWGVLSVSEEDWDRLVKDHKAVSERLVHFTFRH